MIRMCVMMLLVCALAIGGEIGGFWKSIDDETGQARCVVAIYEYGGRYYGRIIGSYDDSGRMEDTIYTPIERAPGVAGNPYYCGMDIIWALAPKGMTFNGKIIDPEKGNVYNCELWTNNGYLIVRGKLLFFGKNQTWLPATESDFPPDFAIPDVTQFIPQLPRVK